SSGCLAVAALGAAGAAGAGYVYYQGKLTRDFVATFDDARAAVLRSLADLNLPVTGEERTGSSGEIQGLTRTGDKVHASLESLPIANAGDPPRTRVGVRVGTFGDHPLSEQILSAVAAQLRATPETQNPVAAWGSPSTDGVQPAAYTTPQTAEPPLSPATPKK